MSQDQENNRIPKITWYARSKLLIRNTYLLMTTINLPNHNNLTQIPRPITMDSCVDLCLILSV